MRSVCTIKNGGGGVVPKDCFVEVQKVKTENNISSLWHKAERAQRCIINRAS